MLPAAVAEALAWLEGVAPLGSPRFSFHRDDTDSFTLSIAPVVLGADREGDGHATQAIQKDDLLPLLPAGSHWNPAVGWRSFVVLPFSIPGICDAAIGVEGVVPHSTRGAFPVMRAVLVRAEDVSAALLTLSAKLPGGGRIAAPLERRQLIEPSDARSPQAHEPLEGAMLRAAAEAWRFGEARLLRTVMLTDDQAPWPRHWADKVRDIATAASRPAYLIATVPRSGPTSPRRPAAHSGGKS